MEKAYKTCLEMLQQREYEITDTEEENRVIALKPDDGESVVVYFVQIPKFNVKSMAEYISLMNELGISHGIIVYKNTVTAMTKKAIEQSSEMRLELFTEEDLQYNITKHRLQPTFIKLSRTEAEDFKEKYGLKYPTLRKDDPIALFYDYSRGDIIKIVRNSGHVTYRIVKG